VLSTSIFHGTHVANPDLTTHSWAYGASLERGTKIAGTRLEASVECSPGLPVSAIRRREREGKRKGKRFTVEQARRVRLAPPGFLSFKFQVSSFEICFSVGSRVLRLCELPFRLHSKPLASYFQRGRVFLVSHPQAYRRKSAELTRNRHQVLRAAGGRFDGNALPQVSFATWGTTLNTHGDY